MFQIFKCTAKQSLRCRQRQFLETQWPQIHLLCKGPLVKIKRSHVYYGTFVELRSLRSIQTATEGLIMSGPSGATKLQRRRASDPSAECLLQDTSSMEYPKIINVRPKHDSEFIALNRKKSRADRLTDKIHAACWVGAGLLTGYFSKFWSVMTLQDDGIIFPLHVAAVSLLVINIILGFYLTMYVPRKLSIPRDCSLSSAWNMYCPKVIPIMTCNGVVCGFCFIRATWPIWHVLSPLIIGLEFVAMLFSLHFIPWCG